MSIITTPVLHRLWQDAQIHPKWATTRLWEYIFNRVIFNDDRWIVSSQQPPTRQPEDTRRIDIVVERIDNNASVVGTLLFVTAKQPSASTTDIQEVEYQALSTAYAYYAETRMKQFWSMTCVGSMARLWIFSEKSTYLIPYIPAGRGLAAQSEYLEISINGQDIVDGLNFIKRYPTPPDELLEKTPSSIPTNAPLPLHWHDNEVAQLDMSHQQGGTAPSASTSASYPTDGRDAWTGSFPDATGL